MFNMKAPDTSFLTPSWATVMALLLPAVLVMGVAQSEDRLAELERLSQQARKAREKMVVKQQKQFEQEAKDRAKLEKKNKEQARKNRKDALKKMEEDVKKRNKAREKERKEERKRWEKEAKNNKGDSSGRDYRSDYQRRGNAKQEWVKVNGRYVPASSSRRDNFGPWMEMGGLSSSGRSSSRTGSWRGSEGGGRNLSMGVRATIIRLNGPNGDE